MPENSCTFVFFPYLKTSEPIRYRNLVIRSTDDLTDLPPNALPHFETIRSMFFLNNFLRIQKMLYAFFDEKQTRISMIDFSRQLLEFQAIVCYFYSAPHPTFGDPFLRKEHATFYLLQPSRFSKYVVLHEHNVEMLAAAEELEADERGDLEGYAGQFNRDSDFLVVSSSRILPPSMGMGLNISQDLDRDLSLASGSFKSTFDYFNERGENDPVGERVLTAIEWYNRTLGIGTPEEVALVHLAIAFECLLDLKQGTNLTDRFSEAVTVLVGGVPRLDSWLEQFYDARSQIVHEGYLSRSKFVAVDNLKDMVKAHRKDPEEIAELEYRSLVSYGRQVFRVCVATMLTGASIAEELKLGALLITNQQRFTSICKLLAEEELDPVERIEKTRGDVYDIAAYRFVSEKGLKIDTLIGTAQAMVRQYLCLDPSEEPKTLDVMQKFTQVKSNEHFEALSLLELIHRHLGQKELSTEYTSVRRIVSTLIDSVWHYTFMEYFALARQKERREVENS